MRVLQVITKGEVGGAQSHVLTLVRYLVQRGVPVQVAIGGPDIGLLGTQMHDMGIATHSLRTLDNTLSPWKIGRAVGELRQVIRREHPTLLHAHSATAGVIARIAGRLEKCPVVYTVHGFAFKPGSPWLRRAVAWCTEWLLAPWTHHMICVSSHERSWARKLPVPSTRVSTIPNGVEDTLYRARPHMPPSVVMVARIAPPKRPDLLLHALALLRTQISIDVPILFFGSGPLLAEQRALAERLGLGSVVFAGDVPDIPQRLAEHTIFVLMSDHEGLPISIIEAMRAGLPVIASDLPGIRELLQTDGGQCIPNDAVALAEALRRLIEDPQLRTQLGATARQHFEDNYTSDRMGASVIEHYTALHP